MFLAFGVVLTLGVFLGYILPGPWSLGIRLILTLATFLVAARLAILRYIFGQGPGAPRSLLLWSSFFQNILVFLFIFAFFRFLVAAFFGLFSLAPGQLGLLAHNLQISLFSAKVSLILTIIASILSGCGLYEATRVPQIRRSELVFKVWPLALSGLKVAVWSDPHISRFFGSSWVSKIVAATMAEKPDLILCAGDLVDGSVESLTEEVAPLANLKAPYGVFSCLGNHEYYSGLDEWAPVFEKLGLTFLNNSHATIGPQNQPVVVAGLTDPTALHPYFQKPGPDLAKALWGAPEAPIILLEHRPALAHERAQNPNIIWRISGHTHGGMFPLLKAVVKKFNQGFASGWYEVGGTRQFVHPGLGLWGGFPIRLFNPSELTIVTIRATNF
ncbi:MAG: metallophosphoesterase [Deltaproteobacteria bacterium]|jgi:predicted MPP superfamily phosphohydrolase|nr:metallophosphoesterase [Deltaproteobacteria bacterium]